MSKSTTPQGPAAPTFELFKAAHASVVDTRDKLKVFALMSEPHGEFGVGDTEDGDALAWCFSRLAGELDLVVRVKVLPEESLPV
jgi:hypothetical protein